jgi:ribosomal protein L34E
MIKEYTLTGHYAFQDYAIMHWIDHLEASIPYLSTCVSDSFDDISSAIIDYYEAYGSADAGEEDIPQMLKDKSAHLKSAKFYKQLLLLVSSTRKLRAKEERVTGLGDLGEVIAKNRSLLEAVRSSGLEPTTISSLEQFYGKSWHKCPRHACYYFHEGFSDTAQRDNHIVRHDKPYVCTTVGCSREHYGFSTEKELKKHMNTTHPDPAALFPKIKKLPAKHICDICGKDFTRAHNLKAHKHSHANERPYGCKYCNKAFVRKHDRDRHIEKLHADKGDEDGERSQETLVEPSLQAPEEFST